MRIVKYLNNVTSRVFTSIFYYIKYKENDPPPLLWRPCFLPIRTIFELNRHIQKTHVMTKFHEDWTKNVTSRFIYRSYRPLHEVFKVRLGHVTSRKTAPPPGGHVFFTDLDHFRTLFTRNTAPPPGGHVFQWTGTIFELKQHII
ncbi:hypothetical protein DPMN_087655 [Dreissena polymorpha]|uniref:Uncharacterized protein n=1 Tax=Dreissena polymorpha TaxID=45954 RepID=A0A9D4KSS5_DREPO|nr:hypothetical protein DPMN_087655 [Dreissena polymorpha]